MSRPPLPEAFLERLTDQLGSAMPDYLAAMEQPAQRGLRVNPHKVPDEPLSELIDGLLGAVPWEPDGFLLTPDSTAGSHPLHEAGAYYLQEPSAMLPARVLCAQPGETVLDLCAAPGGKSTQLACAMAGRGTLVCNEIVPSRAKVLSRNLERMGVTNALAVSADPARLALVWPQLFDAILVDAPCSGEGMFRRHPEVCAEWDADTPARCALRQQAILQSACRMLKPGGRLCYSTCTFNREENDATVTALCKAHPELEPLPFSVPDGHGGTLSSLEGGLHLYPHEVPGEGHFVALLQKTARGADDPATGAALSSAAASLAPPPKLALQLWQAFLSELGLPKSLAPNAALGDALLCSPELPPLEGIRVLRAGLTLGQAHSHGFVPDHALAMAAPPPNLPHVPLTVQEACTFQRGEALPAPDGLRRYHVVTLNSLPLGFVKASDGWLKNHYPKGLRRP